MKTRWVAASVMLSPRAGLAVCLHGRSRRARIECMVVRFTRIFAMQHARFDTFLHSCGTTRSGQLALAPTGALCLNSPRWMKQGCRADGPRG
ncbi:exported hypothetical protein [Cupriavidus taiwanensis]|uniref:Uncharacterized protein n=1 Tax=Cupriavidus taiwanensis TaxID=164546 RepID=A0A976G338_9BURK|nr:exported hypothetical protein [Cupriavidus taiwanensis]SOZ26720.1 exported hypothetical protein [Cupriavidus taiwanensis]SOZ45443.1 exported hypothetical protein [Cupriavidus taiwanensis]SOZ59327.1 exported hypothetical protein [Cupriavidus taiwanensis]SOZ59945.1 exported hypothetical protein [Cupriavidus taiwanensis]